MRVTKLIREYVENEVEKAYKDKTPDEMAYDKLRKEIVDFREKINDEIADVFLTIYRDGQILQKVIP